MFLMSAKSVAARPEFMSAALEFTSWVNVKLRVPQFASALELATDKSYQET